MAWGVTDPSLPILSFRTELNLHQMAESSAFGMGVWSEVGGPPPDCFPVPGLPRVGGDGESCDLTHCLLLLRSVVGNGSHGGVEGAAFVGSGLGETCP